MREGAAIGPGYLLGTRVPNLGAPLGILMVVGVAWLPGLEEGEDSTLPLD